MNNPDLKRFLDAQNQVYLKALSEIRNGKKETHWMRFIFPQLAGIAQSETAKFYAITDLQQATEYLAHPVLGKHLVQISKELLATGQVFTHPDDLKLRSSMTLFANVENTDPVFAEVLGKYFNGLQDQTTLQLLSTDRLSHANV